MFVYCFLLRFALLPQTLCWILIILWNYYCHTSGRFCLGSYFTFGSNSISSFVGCRCFPSSPCLRLVLFTSRLEPSPDLGSSLSGTWTRGLEPGSSRQKSAKNAPRGSSLESSRLVDPCLSHQEAACQETQVRSSSRHSRARRTRAGSARVWLESARLVHNTTCAEGFGKIQDRLRYKLYGCFHSLIDNKTTIVPPLLIYLNRMH